jgi:CHASE2 domain-containing sensor protein
MAPMPLDLAAGVVLDAKYLLQSRIGGGRFGVVYRAVHIALQKTIAVKVLEAGERLGALDFQQFRVEAEALGRLSHPHIVGVTDFGVDPGGGGTPYLVMELVEGPTLEQVLAREGAVDVLRAAPWIAQIASALDHAHASGVVHGDLSPNNVVVVGEGAAAAAKVIDFGLARFVQHEPPADVGSEHGRRITGTPGYAAPEQLRGEPPSSAADIYALGSVAFRLLTGRAAFEGDARTVMTAQLTSDAPLASTKAPALPRALDGLLARALSRRASDRPASAGDLARAIAAAARAEHRARWQRREAPRRLAIATGLAALAVVLGRPLASMDVVERLEGATMNVRFALSRPVPPDPRLLLVAIDDESLGMDAAPLATQADAFATTIRAALDRGAAAVALDLLLPATWSESKAFGDLVLTHADRLVLGLAADERSAVGPEAIDPLVASALGPEGASRLFGLVTHVPAPDGVVRVARAGVVDRSGALRPTLAGRVREIAAGPAAAAVVGTDGVLVNYTVDSARVDRRAWRQFAADVQSGARFDGRLVLVGAEFTGSGDRHRIPGPGRLSAEVSGLTLQGIVTHTLLTRSTLEPAAPVVTWGTVGLAAFGAAWSMLWVYRWRTAWSVVFGAGLAGVSAAAAAFAAGHVAPLAAPLLVWSIVVGAALLLRLRLPAPVGGEVKMPAGAGTARLMTRAAFILIALLGTADLHAQPRPARPPAPAASAVAMIARATGDITVESRSGAREAARFERLADGDVIRTGRGAEVMVVFRTGARVRLGETSRARVDGERAVRLDGTLEILPPVPPVPLVAPVAGAGTTITAVRIRAGGLTLVSPIDDATTLAGSTVLEFAPAATDAYEVEIEGPDAAVVHRARTRETRVIVPEGRLRPGTAYRWRVTARMASGFDLSGEGRFHTLAAGAVDARAKLRQGLPAGDADALALLAEVDRTLGLVEEALAGFLAARTAGAVDPIVAARIAELERLRGGVRPPGQGMQ